MVNVDEHERSQGQSERAVKVREEVNMNELEKECHSKEFESLKDGDCDE